MKYSIVRKKKLVQEKKKEAPTETPVPTELAASDSRYFDNNESSTSQTVSNVPKVTKTAPLLPDFIKI